MGKTEEGRNCLVDDSTPSERFKLPYKGGTDNMDDRVLHIGGTPKSMASLEGYDIALTYSENSKAPIGATNVPTRLLVIRGPLNE
ncbi:uncharacterized protein E6C27_scaffold181G00250 [Cucumis melo var. makuwa]|uniref:Uncharacterized protein n=1 Tax=Cucumis melo var. makuwa TaxID=1194695 RepID=A0A5A7UM46_CUCMM|nr:uncharacterized protein E6C27_scaffold181G00250 [Cucumis melo var. makuwa]